MKKRNVLILVLAVICAVSVILVACEKHEHEFSRQWTYDSTYHWREAVCCDTDEVADKAAHNFVNGACSTCKCESDGISWKPVTGSSTSGSNAIVMPTNYPQKASEPSLMLHYYRTNSNDYTSWSYWIWPDGGEGVRYPIGYQDSANDSHCSITIVPLSTIGTTTSGTIGIIPSTESWAKDGDADRMLDLSVCTLGDDNYIHIYLVQGDISLYKAEKDYNNGVQSLQYGLEAYFTAENKISITTASPIKFVRIYEGDAVIAESETDETKNVVYKFENGGQMDFDKQYKVSVTFAADLEIRECAVSISQMFDAESFNKAYYYDGELGAIYSPSQTEFKVWSPVSSKIVLNLYEAGNGGAAYETKEMTKGEKGVFSVTVSGDLAAKYYTYTVYNSTYPNGMEIVDPYAKSAGLNGVRGQIVDFDTINNSIAGWDSVQPHSYDANELVVWETHVADVTSSTTWTGTEAYRKKFLGMIEAGTTYSENGITVTTGFDHIKELGVNAVQLVPIFDQAGSDEANKAFNWGYNPLNYNVLEGGYATDATDGYVRIREFKQLVQAFNGAGINIIMDVVYNHVNAAGGSNFDVLMPGYYYRYTSSGALSNGSGCGNETASERSMFRKFMIDSVCFWASEYKLGGFRFDLMGLHDIETMNQLTEALKKVNPSIVVYGEPWTGGSTTLASSQQAKQDNGNKYVGYGQFNDQMRDALIKGGMNSAGSRGWVTNPSGSNGDVSNILYGLQGFTASKIKDLYKTVNYVTCHDNYTLYDRIKASGTSDEGTVRKMAMLANSVVFTSNGVNFMLAGEEFLRSKAAGGAIGEQVHNSYNASYKVNELDYALKIKNIDIFTNYQKLIAFKQMFVDMGLTSNDAVAANYKVSSLNSGSVIEIVITAKDGTTWKIVHANGAASGVTADFNGYTLYLDTLNSNVSLSGATSVLPYQTIIAKK